MSSHTRLWMDKVSSVALAGLHGCTSIVILSEYGVWISHSWEDPSFTGMTLSPPILTFEGESVVHYQPATYDEQDRQIRFQSEVIDAIANGRDGYHFYGLAQLSGQPTNPGDRYASMFHESRHPIAYIFTPRRLPPLDALDRQKITYADDDLRYPSQIEEIKNKLTSFIKFQVEPKVVSYTPILVSLRAEQSLTLQQITEYETDAAGVRNDGKILIQYRPENTRAVNRCQRHLLSQARIWWDGSPLDGLKWDSDLNLRKRDDSTACNITTTSSDSTSASASSTSAPPSPTTSIITPTNTLTTTPTPTAVPASLISCYNSRKLSCYDPVPPDMARSKSDKFCSDHASINPTSGPDWPGIWFISNDFLGSISYHWKVSWKAGCVVADGQDTTINVVSCQNAMHKAFEDCNNGGHGGTFVDGCLEYSFSPVNQGGGDCGLPFLDSILLR
ncbi:hypothetical protein GGR54DRAFT_591614 [Hypoxylon sp. NC1633]|nr:hypothetical protein GGR54DRAFT_591614 [Hypoxylon sp. NC1633]